MRSGRGGTRRWTPYVYRLRLEHLPLPVALTLIAPLRHIRQATVARHYTKLIRTRLPHRAQGVTDEVVASIAAMAATATSSSDGERTDDGASVIEVFLAETQERGYGYDHGDDKRGESMEVTGLSFGLCFSTKHSQDPERQKQKRACQQQAGQKKRWIGAGGGGGGEENSAEASRPIGFGRVV